MKLLDISETRKEYLNAKIDELESKSKIENIRDLYMGISDFKKCYQPRTYTVNNEKENLVTEVHSILARWRDHFSQLLNVHGVHVVRHRNTHNRTTSA